MTLTNGASTGPGSVIPRTLLNIQSIEATEEHTEEHQLEKAVMWEGQVLETEISDRLLFLDLNKW